MLAQNENVGTPPEKRDMVEGCLSIGFCVRAGRKWCFPFFWWLSQISGGGLLSTKGKGTFRSLREKSSKHNHCLRKIHARKSFSKAKCMTKRHHRKNGIWLKAANQSVLVCEQDAHDASRFSGGYPKFPVVA